MADMAFKNNLYYFRAKAQLTQQELADKCGIARSYVSAFELGSRTPTLETLQNLAKSLDCSVNDLMYGPGTEKSERLTPCSS